MRFLAIRGARITSFLLPKSREKGILIIKAMEIISARLLFASALLVAAATSVPAADLVLKKTPALTVEQASLYPQNLARIDLGAQINVTPQGDVAQSAALLSGDATAIWNVAPGTHTVLISLGKIEQLDSINFLNTDAKGSVVIATANANLGPENSQWREAGKQELRNGIFRAKIGPAEAKYVRLTLNVTQPGRIASLGVYGGAGVADFTMPRQRIAGEIAQVNYNLTDVHTKARTLYVSSGNEALANQMIDEQPATTYAFAANDTAPAAIVDLGREMTLRRIAVLSTPGAGTAHFYVLNALPANAPGASAPETLRLDEGAIAGLESVGSANDDGSGRAAVDFPETSARYVLVKWSPANPNFSVAEIATFGRAPTNMLFAANSAVDRSGKNVADAKDGKDAKDFKDIPAEGPEAPAEAPPPALPPQPPFVFIPQVAPTSP